MRFVMQRVLPALLLLIIVLMMGVYFILRASQLPLTTTLINQTVSAPVSVRFDAYARPYVQAKTMDDALYAQGLLHASERLWQMELLRLAGRAELHLLLGRDALATDEELWRIGVPQLASALTDNAEPQVAEWVRAYVAGINAGLARYSLWPPELLLLGYRPEPWKMDDVFAVGAIIAFQSGNNYTKELVRQRLQKNVSAHRFALFLDDYSDRADYPFVLAAGSPVKPPELADATQALPAALLARAELLDPLTNPLMPRGAFGSNGWVVAAEKSSTGTPLFAFDSHDALGLPNLFYEVHLFFEQDAQIRGWSVPGLPGVINGYNESIAWGFTNIGDTQDLFIETPHPEHADTFLYDGEWYTAQVETRTLTLADGSLHNQVRKLSRHGPLISEDPPVSLAWTGHQPGEKGLGALLAINRAGNWAEFNRAADELLAPTLNATYADRHGAIGFRTAGVLPQRGSGNGLIPLDGSEAQNRWRGWVPASDMPRAHNPDSGFLAAANARVNPAASFPLVSADNAAPYRIARIQSVLSGQDIITPAQMAALQMDWVDGQAAWLLPHLLPALAPEHAEWQQRFGDWLVNPVAAPDSAEALVFQQWYLNLAKGLFEEALGDDYPALLKQNYLLNQALDVLIVSDRHSDWWQGSRAGKINAAFTASLASLRQRLGPDTSQWRLDAVQTADAPHELAKALPALGPILNAGASVWGGSPAAVGRANYRYDKPFAVNNGATVRVVAALGERISAQAVMPGGQSGHPLSAHYRNQWAHWLQGELLPIASEPDQMPTQLLLEPSL